MAKQKRLKLEKLFEKAQKTQIDFENAKNKLNSYKEQLTGSDDFGCVDGRENPRQYSFKEYMYKEGMDEDSFN